VLGEVFQLPTEQLDEGRVKKKRKVSSAR